MSLLIGEVARRSGLSHDTLRYYERVGLVPPPQRDTGGRRRYDGGVLDLLAVIMPLREAGFTLDQVRDVLGVRLPGQSARERVDAMRTVIADLGADLRTRRVAIDTAEGLLTRMSAELDAGEPYSDDPLEC